ncbi:MAG TPA: GNAT family N-acetyltransferase [Spirochaetota bacterium]|nr:GNAT family N-acetyltransferase [Spirochaetota bacterium]
MIRAAAQDDFDTIYEIINDASIAYKGIIPEDRWHEPYMPESELLEQIDDGVNFYCYCDKTRITGVMGIQDKGDVKLIRHAYVRTSERGKGIGSKLLEFLMKESDKPLLIGTWETASWAISFYVKHGFNIVSRGEKDGLLGKYWKIPKRQMETSVVLSDNNYRK